LFGIRHKMWIDGTGPMAV